jgi:hypothetical protein
MHILNNEFLVEFAQNFIRLHQSNLPLPLLENQAASASSFKHSKSMQQVKLLLQLFYRINSIEK